MPSHPFRKLHGTGNDFMFLNGIDREIRLKPQTVRNWADRNTGIGFDQLIIAERSSLPEVDYRMVVLNADGSEAGQCGNGARCLPLFIRAENISERSEFAIEIGTSVVHARIRQNRSNRSAETEVDFAAPKLDPAALPLLVSAPGPHHALVLGDGSESVIKFTAVSVGSPHLVTLVDSVNAAPVSRVGSALQVHRALPNGANVSFLQIVSPSEARLRVYERGAGETRSCGSAAVAALVAGQLLGKLEERCSIVQKGGPLYAFWAGGHNKARIAGAAAITFEGVIRG